MSKESGFKAPRPVPRTSQNRNGPAPRGRRTSLLALQSERDFNRSIEILKAQWEETQRRTYTKWVNLYLSKRKPPIKLTDIVDDFKSGPEQMAKLLEILCGCRIDTESGRLPGQRSTSRIHQINIVQNALEALKQARPDINMVGINPSDIVDGKASVVLGLIWRMVLNFQIEEVLEQLKKYDDIGVETKSKKKSADSARKAMLKWIRKTGEKVKTPDAIDVEINDFGPSFRDGRAFHSLLHAIDEEAVDPALAHRGTNKERLEAAFKIAEERFGIPQILDAEDIDVDKPDEKSVMMYVAEIIKVAEARLGTSGNVNADLTDAAIELDRLLTWTAGAEEALKKKHKLRKYTPKDFNDYKDFEKNLHEKEESFQKIAPKCDPDQVKLIAACFENLDKSKTRWLDGFDKHLPKELRKVGDFLKKAEKGVRKIEESEDALREEFSESEPKDPESSIHSLDSRIKDHNETFENMSEMIELVKAAGRNGTLDQQQLDFIQGRLDKIESTSIYRLAWLEYSEARYRLLGYIAAAQAQLKYWTSPMSAVEEVENKLRDWQQLMDLGEFGAKLEQASEQLKDKTTRYVKCGLITPKERENVKRMTDDKTAQARMILVEMNSTKALLENTVERWTKYIDLLEQSTKWLDEAEQVRDRSDAQSDAFFTHEGIEEVQKRIKGLNACSEFLREHVEHEKEEIIAEQTNDVNQRWNDLQELMRQVVKRNELRANEDKFRENVEKIQKWLSETEELLQQSIVTQLDEIADYEQTLALVKNEQMSEMEKLYRTTSTAAQVVCRSNPSKELTKQKLKIMSQIKDRYISVRETVDKALEAASNLQTPLNSLEEIYNDVQSWHDEAEEVLESYEDPNCGLEDIERLLELHAAQFGQEVLNEVEANISRMRSNVATVNDVKMPSMDSSDVENRVLQLNRAVETIRRQAAAWGPRIDSLSRKWDDLQKWIKDSEDALNDSEGFLTQQEVPKKEELEELADTVSKLLSKAPMIKCDFEDLKQNLTNLADHEQHCDELVPLMKETLDALLTITERIEINKLVKGVQDEIEKARNVLTDIRETLKSDGPKVAIETRELKLERSPNPIREAKRLLENVSEKFRAEPDEINQRLVENLRTQIDQLASNEKDLAKELDGLPEKVDVFMQEMDDISTMLSAACKSDEPVDFAKTEELEKAEELLCSWEGPGKDKEKIEKNLNEARTKLENISASLPRPFREEQEEQILAFAAEARDKSSKMEKLKKQLGQARAAHKMKDRINSAIEEIEIMEDELSQTDQNGQKRFIDSVRDSKKQNEMHERLCQDYKEQQTVVLAEILELEKPLAGDSSEICNKIIGPTTENFKHKIKEFESRMSERGEFLKKNLKAWSGFEELVDEISRRLDKIEAEKGKSKYDSLQVLEKHLTVLEDNKQSLSISPFGQK